jgi:integrase
MMVCFERAVKDAGIRDFHFHDLRHTFATRLRAAGVHEMDIMTLLGHTTLKVTQGYALSVPNVLRKAVSSLERARLLTFTPTSRQVAREAEG